MVRDEGLERSFKEHQLLMPGQRYVSLPRKQKSDGRDEGSRQNIIQGKARQASILRNRKKDRFGTLLHKQILY